MVYCEKRINETPIRKQDPLADFPKVASNAGERVKMIKNGKGPMPVHTIG
jgi:hypothetical protein